MTSLSTQKEQVTVKRAIIPSNNSCGMVWSYCPYCHAKNIGWVENGKPSKAARCKHFKGFIMKPQLNEVEEILWREREQAKSNYTAKFKKEWIELDRKLKIVHFIFEARFSKDG